MKGNVGVWFREEIKRKCNKRYGIKGERFCGLEGGYRTNKYYECKGYYEKINQRLRLEGNSEIVTS